MIRTRLGQFFDVLHTGKINHWDPHPFRQESVIPDAFLGEMVLPNVRLALEHTKTKEQVNYFAYISEVEGFGSFFVGSPKLDLLTVTAELIPVLGEAWGDDDYYVVDSAFMGTHRLPDSDGVHPEMPWTLGKGLYIATGRCVPPSPQENDRRKITPYWIRGKVTKKDGTFRYWDFPVAEIYSQLCADDNAFWGTLDKPEVAKALRAHIEDDGRLVMHYVCPTDELESVEVDINGEKILA